MVGRVRGGAASDEFVSKYSIPRIITQYQGFSRFLSAFCLHTSVSRPDDHAQHNELSAIAETMKMVKDLLDFKANWKEFYDHSYFRDLISNQRRIRK